MANKKNAGITARQLVEDYIEQLTRETPRVSTRHHLNQILALFNNGRNFFAWNALFPGGARDFSA